MPDNCNFDAVPLTQAQQIRTPNLYHVSYTNQDFWSLKNRLVQFIKERFGSDFNDFFESDLGILLIENWAFIADMLSFKMDQIANEVFIDTVTELENAFRQAKLVGFEPTPPIGARAMFSLSLGGLLSTDLVIPTPLGVDVVANDVATRFELFPADENNDPLFDQDIIIPAGQFSNTSIVGIEGVTTIDQFEGTGEVSQTITLVTSPVIFDSIRVDVDGVRWERVDAFTDSQPRREYRVEFNSTWQAFVIFGNSRAGAIPPAGSQIFVTYRVGGGSFGNIVTNAVQTQRPFEVDGFDISVPVTITNYTKAEFGYDGDTIADIKQKLPAYIRSQDRAVTGDDYKTLANQFATAYQGQVGKATAVLRNTGCAGNIIDLFVLARNGANDLQEATEGLKYELATMLEEKKMITDHVCIKDGVVLEVDVAIELTLDKFFKKFKDEIKLRAERTVDDFFNLNNWDYGLTLKDADINKALSSIKEVKSSIVTLVTNSIDNSGSIVTSKYYEIIRPDNIVITFNFE